MVCAQIQLKLGIVSDDGGLGITPPWPDAVRLAQFDQRVELLNQ